LDRRSLAWELLGNFVSKNFCNARKVVTETQAIVLNAHSPNLGHVLTQNGTLQADVMYPLHFSLKLRIIEHSNN
jgi:hypothetical protein